MSFNYNGAERFIERLFGDDRERPVSPLALGIGWYNPAETFTYHSASLPKSETTPQAADPEASSDETNDYEFM